VQGVRGVQAFAQTFWTVCDVFIFSRNTIIFLNQRPATPAPLAPTYRAMVSGGVLLAIIGAPIYC